VHTRRARARRGGRRTGGCGARRCARAPSARASTACRSCCCAPTGPPAACSAAAASTAAATTSWRPTCTSPGARPGRSGAPAAAPRCARMPGWRPARGRARCEPVALAARVRRRARAWRTAQTWAPSRARLTRPAAQGVPGVPARDRPRPRHPARPRVAAVRGAHALLARAPCLLQYVAPARHGVQERKQRACRHPWPGRLSPSAAAPAQGQLSGGRPEPGARGADHPQHGQHRRVPAGGVCQHRRAGACGPGRPAQAPKTLSMGGRGRAARRGVCDGGQGAGRADDRCAPRAAHAPGARRRAARG